MPQLNTLILFQFHYGTIKRYKAIINVIKIKLFQFHYGTIKSIPGLHKSTKKSSFNSTMVRLKVLRHAAIKYPYIVSIPLWYD